MTLSIGRSLRNAAAAILIAALPAATMAPALAQAPAMPGGAMPGMPTLGGEPFPLTQAFIEGWVESYPDVLEATEALEDQYDVPEGDDPAAGMVALAAYADAMAQLNGVVTPHGFANFQEWIDVMFAIMYSYAMLQAPPEARAMMAGMLPTTPENIALVEANAELIGNVVDNM